MNDKFIIYNPYIYENGIYYVSRCGIIPYCRINDNQFKLLMGRKRHWGSFLGDFGGGVKKHETWLQGLIREVDEESNNIFGPAKDFIEQALCRISTKKMVLVSKRSPSIRIEYLVEVNYNQNYISAFKNFGYNEEILNLEWISVNKTKGGNCHMPYLINNKLDGTIMPYVDQILDHLRLSSCTLSKVLPLFKMLCHDYIPSPLFLTTAPKLLPKYKPLVITNSSSIFIPQKYKFFQPKYRGLAYIPNFDKVINQPRSKKNSKVTLSDFIASSAIKNTNNTNVNDFMQPSLEEDY